MVVFVIYMEALHVYECLPKKDNETVEWSKQTCFNVGGGGLLMGIEKHSIGIPSVGNSCFFGKLLRKLSINFSETHSTNFSKNRSYNKMWAYYMVDLCSSMRPIF